MNHKNVFFALALLSMAHGALAMEEQHPFVTPRSNARKKAMAQRQANFVTPRSEERKKAMKARQQAQTSTTTCTRDDSSNAIIRADEESHALRVQAEAERAEAMNALTDMDWSNVTFIRGSRKKATEPAVAVVAVKDLTRDPLSPNSQQRMLQAVLVQPLAHRPLLQKLMHRFLCNRLFNSPVVTSPVTSRSARRASRLFITNDANTSTTSSDKKTT